VLVLTNETLGGNLLDYGAKSCSGTILHGIIWHIAVGERTSPNVFCANGFLKNFPCHCARAGKTRHHIINHSANSLHACSFETRNLTRVSTWDRCNWCESGKPAGAMICTIIFPLQCARPGAVFKRARRRGSNSVAVGSVPSEHGPRLKICDALQQHEIPLRHGSHAHSDNLTPCKVSATLEQPSNQKSRTTHIAGSEHSSCRLHVQRDAPCVHYDLKPRNSFSRTTEI
jgi:hypothetical protein